MKYFFTGLALILFSAYSDAQTFRVDDIRLEGLQRVSASPVFAALPIRIGEEIDTEDVRQILRALFATGFFNNVQVAREGNVLIIVLQERPAIKAVEVDGNKAIKTEQLEDVFTEQKLVEGEILQRAALQGITRELERQYIGRARYGAKVEANVEALQNNMVEVKIDVDEGKSAHIKHLNIVGNKIFSDEEILESFELKTSNWRSFFTKSDQYSREKLSGDVESLESFYLDRGYLDFSTTSSQVSVSPDKETVYITLNVHEGEVYTVDEVEIAGDPKISEERVRRLILLRKGNTFSQAAMTNTSEYITGLLGNAGYTNAKVEGIPEKDPETKTVKLTFLVDPGKRVYVRRIEFRGNTKTSDEVLRREMRQMEGSSASNARIEQSKVRLERLGFFSEVTVENLDVPGTSDLVDVEFTVEEQPSGSITATIGYAEFTDLQLGLSLQQNNWLGTGKQVGLSINKNRYIESYNWSYNDPYYTADGVSRGFNLLYTKQNYDGLTSANFRTDKLGANVSFGYPISEISRLGMQLGYSHDEVTPQSGAPKEIASSPAFFTYQPSVSNPQYILQSDWEQYVLNGSEEYLLETTAITDEVIPVSEPGFLDKYGSQYDSATASLSWSRVTLNRGVFANRGTRQRLSLFTTMPGGDLEYYTIKYDAEAFVPLTRAFTLRLKTTLGYGDGFGDMDELPFFENFQAGGLGSIRGFDRSTIGPKGSPSSVYERAPAGWQDLDRDGVIHPQRLEYFGANSYVYCEDPTSADLRAREADGRRRVCEPGQLIYSTGTVAPTYRYRAFGGNILMEFGAEVLIPIPFVEDTRSMQLVAFVDAGNVFASECNETQRDCTDIDISELRSSYGFGFTWLSGMGPMTFAVSRPIYIGPNDRREAFQFSFGAGF